jgi:hypothetical protein
MSAAPPIRDRVSEHEIAGIVLGEPTVPSNPPSFVATALRHRMAPLLVHAGAASRLPQADAARLVEEARNEAVLSELRDRELCRVLAALRADGLRVLVMKGAHLAQSHYDESCLRPRDDADLLIERVECEPLSEALARIGYAHLPDITGDVVHGQMVFGRTANIPVVLDVHWRVASPRIAAGLLSFEELTRRAVDLPRLGPGARGPAPVHALALACIHQSAHHPGHELLLWMYDIYLLVSRFGAAEIDEFAAMAVERRMARMCAHAVSGATGYFPASNADALLKKLAVADEDEPTAFLVNARSPMRQLASDLAATREWSARARLLFAHLFPPPAYMRHTYGVSSAALLPWLYGYRIARGAGRWLRGKARVH